MKPLSTGDPIRLGPYRLLGVLGEGGMGKVYLGQDGTGRPAAVKVLRPELAHDQHLAQRFVREAEMAKAVTSKGVARVLGSQTEGGRPWIATEFLAGPTLDEAIGAYGPMDGPTVRALADALARTLHDIHTAGLIHRDLKPPNIVLTSSGPRIIDFGIARPEHGLTLTTTGQIPVTPGYGAPEQILGRRVGPAADVFSLGAVLVYAASGRRAFDAAHVAAVQYEVVHGEPDLSQVSTELQALIGPCLAKDAALRPDPGQIAAAFTPPKGADRVWRSGPLAAGIKTRETDVHRVTTAVDGPRPVSRRRMLTALAAGGTVLAAGGGTGTWWWLRDGSGSGTGTNADGPSDPFDIPPAVQAEEAKLLDPDKGEYIVGEAPKALWGPVQAVAADTPAPLPVGDVVVIGAKAGGVAAFDMVTGKQRWRAPTAVPSGRYLSLSDRLVALVDAKGTLRTYVPSTGVPKWTARAEARSLLAEDDDAVYVVTKDGRLRSIGRSDAKVRWTARVTVNLSAEVHPLGIAAAGRLVLWTAEGDVLAVDSTDGSEVWDRLKQSDEILRPAHQDGVVYLGGKTLTALNIGDGKELWSVPAGKDYLGAPKPWRFPTAYPGMLFAAHDDEPKRLNPKTGKELWGMGSGDGPMRMQGSGVWVVDTDEQLPRVSGLDLTTGYPRMVYKTGEGSRWGLAAAGNRVFVHDSHSLTALPVF
ncbi:PQQ-binding-like beta-propeller repeat protein [Streptomyces sp. ISL-98]|uniref:serine/threonine-protein kinase n=1 Tax=Streptomyces sp. ISL-98 TaxID=2819192 RepID=UPI001BE76794|nr:serine/threonine-protein kinase [Streptomyces sp. ISL-98]MBT2508557.1 PQQ-binding-like beta-propeller repeat protein [Streptomyces sp. ISL-98]